MLASFLAGLSVFVLAGAALFTKARKTRSGKEEVDEAPVPVVSLPCITSPREGDEGMMEVNLASPRYLNDLLDEDPYCSESEGVSDGVMA